MNRGLMIALTCALLFTCFTAIHSQPAEKETSLEVETLHAQITTVLFEQDERIRGQDSLMVYMNRFLEQYMTLHGITERTIDSLMQVSIQEGIRPRDIRPPHEFQPQQSFELFAVVSIEPFYFSKFQYALKKTAYLDTIPDLFTCKDLLNARQMVEDDLRRLKKERMQIEALLHNNKRYRQFAIYLTEKKEASRTEDINLLTYIRRFFHNYPI